MAIRNYVGARYVPKFADPVEWQANTSYEAMVIVTYNNSSYTSKVPVPQTVGNPAENSTYWALTGNYNAQVEQYRQDAETVKNNLSTEITDRKNADTALQGQITTEITSRKNADVTLQNNIYTVSNNLTTEITNRKNADTTLQDNINSEVATRASADSNLQSQINQIVAPSGEAPSAAEVQNARIGADGVTYSTLGDAVRGQYDDLKNQLNYPYYASLSGLHNKVTNLINKSDIVYGPGLNAEVKIGDTLNTFPFGTSYDSHHIIPVNEYDILYITYREYDKCPHIIYCDANMVVIGIDYDTVGTLSSVVFTDRQIIVPKGCSYVVVFSQSLAAPNTGDLNIFKKMAGYYLDEYVNYVSDAPAIRNGSVSATSTDSVACNNIIPINGAKSVEIHCNKKLDKGHSIVYYCNTYPVPSGLTLGAPNRIRFDQLLPADAEGKATLHFIDGEKGFAFSFKELDENGTAVDPLQWYDIQKNDVFYIMNYFSDDDVNAPDFIEESVSNVLDNMTGQDGNTLNLAFITDLHVTAFADLPLQEIEVWKRNANGLACVDKSRNIDFVVLGGDYLWNNTSTTLVRAKRAYKLLQECFYKFKEKQFALKGNHDDNSIAENPDYLISDSVRYGYLGQQYTNDVQIKYGTAEKSYGYIDFKRQKVRAIFINSVDIPSSYSGQHVTGIGNDQLNFVADALRFTDNGWAVIFFSHHLLVNNTTMNPTDDAESYVTITHGGDAIWGIIQAFKNKTTYSTVSTLTDYEYSVDVDYSNNGSSEVIACINGHSHRDLSATQDGVLLISTTASGFGQNAYDSEGNKITYTANTKTETAFDVYSFDRINKTIKASRYGAGQNRNWSY